MMRRAAVALALAGIATPAAAAQRTTRFVGTDEGLVAPQVYTVAQDRSGYLWLGTAAGLWRYDGRRVERIAADVVTGEVPYLAVDDDAIWVAERAGLIRVRDDRADAVSLPPGIEPHDVADPCVGAAGLWMRAQGEPWLRRTDGEWERPLPDPTALGGLFVLRCHDEDLFVIGREAAWLVGDDRVRATLPAADLVDAVAIDDGFAGITHDGRVLAIDGDRVTPWFSMATRGLTLARRGEAVWAAFDVALVRLERDRPPEPIGLADGLRSGGNTLVDRERNLWVASSAGLQQFPEPDTSVWGAADGLPSTHVRYLARDGANVWVSTWQEGLGRIVDDASGLRADTDPQYTVKGSLCRDAGGRMWAVEGRGVLAWTEDTRSFWPINPAPAIGSCVRDDDGVVWLSGSFGIVRSIDMRDGEVPKAWSAPGGYAEWLFVDGDTLVAMAGERVCRAPIAAPGSELAWSCEELPAGVEHASGMVRTGDGELWIGTARGGVLRRGDAGWEPVPASLELPSRRIHALVPSPRGGLWVLAPGSVVRVEPDRADAAGWRELERLGAYQGLPAIGAGHLIEESDGSLWLTYTAGAVRVPAAARFSSPAAPDRGWLEVEGHAGADGGLAYAVVPAPSSVHVRFGVLSYRDPGALRYRVRRRGDPSWTELGSEAGVSLVDLPPGEHAFTFAASLDGETWATTPIVRLAVPPPWWQHGAPWLLALASSLAAIGAWRAGRPVLRLAPAHGHRRG
jgi:ligand-binding sensor domain-containing protein